MQRGKVLSALVRKCGYGFFFCFSQENTSLSFLPERFIFFSFNKKKYIYFFLLLETEQYQFLSVWTSEKKKIKQCKHLLRMKRFQLILFEVTGFLQVS